MDANLLTEHVANCCGSDEVAVMDSNVDSKFICLVFCERHKHFSVMKFKFIFVFFFFSWKVCGQTFKYETGLKKHRQRHEPPGGFICSQCDKRFLTEADRVLHKDAVHKVTFNCNSDVFVLICDSWIIIISNIFQVYKCMICNAKFESEKLFFDHINEMHDGNDREYFICTECGKHFRLKNQLKYVLQSNVLTQFLEWNK